MPIVGGGQPQPTPVPLYSCQIAFASNPLDAVPVWTEVSSLLKAFRIFRGRQHVLNAIEPGRASFTFSGVVPGHERDLDPLNTSGPYYPNVDINKRIRVGVNVNLLSAARAIISGGWTAGANTNALTFPANAMTLTATGSGTISASTPTGTAGFHCQPNRAYNYTLLSTAAVSSRTFTLSVTWYTATGASISTVTVASASDSVGGTTTVGTLAASPSNAAYGSLTYSVAGCVTSEVHTLTKVALIDQLVTNTTNWIAGDPYPLFTGFIDGITPVYSSNLKTDYEITATDTLRILQQTKFPADPFVTRALADGATAIWPLDDPVGSVSVREVVSGHSALVPRDGSVVLGTASRAASFAETTLSSTCSAGQPVSLGLPVQNAGVTQGSRVFSLEGWFQAPASNPPDSSPLIQGTSESPDLLFHYTPTAGGSAEVFISSITDASVAMAPDGKWHHLAATCSATTLSLYVDGILKATAATGGSTFSGSTNVLLANVLVSGSGVGTTLFSDVAVYNGVTLSAAQILDHYTRGIQWFTTPEKSGTRLTDVLSLISFPSSLYAAPGSGSDSGQSNIQAPSTPPTTVKAYLDAVALAEGGIILARPDGVVVLYDRYHQTNVVPTVTFGERTDLGEIPYKVRPEVRRDNIDLYTSSTVTMVGGNPQTYAPKTTTTQYGVDTSLDQSGLISAGGDAEALARAQGNVAKFGTAVTRWSLFTVDMISYLSTAGAGVLLAQPNQTIEIGQQVVTNRRPWSSTLGWGNPTNASTSMIEGIDHNVTFGPKASWTMTVHASPADVQQYWALGTSALGTNTRLAW